MVGIIDENLSTKHDIESLRRDMKELETNLKRDIEQIRAEMATKVELERATVSIIKWNVGAVFTAVGLFATIMKLLG